MLLTLGMPHLELNLYKFYINEDPWLTLTYFMARSNVVAYAFTGDKLSSTASLSDIFPTISFKNITASICEAM